MLFRVFVICFTLTVLFQYSAYSLVGVENAKSSNLPGQKNNNKNTNKSNGNKTTQNKNNNSRQQQQNNNNNGVLSGEKPDDVPDWPDDEEEYQMLFDDGFSNFVDESFQGGEEFDVFVNQNVLNKINNEYIAGNDEEITQMKAMTAEKKTMDNQISIDKNNITTHRTRIMAYLTLDQMLFADFFGEAPHGYYVNAMNKAG